MVDTLGYHIVLQPLGAKHGGGYLATVPDLPGCMSDGHTAEEALENIGEVIAVWRHCAAQAGRGLPQPTCARTGA
jgi:antitoxin HicB